MTRHVCHHLLLLLPTFSPFKPLEHQFVLQQTPLRLVMTALSWIVGACY